MAKQTAGALTEEKANGRVYTPDYIVSNILDLCGYQGEAVLQRHVIDNSCGDGAFLTEAVRRYCGAAAAQGISPEQLGNELGKYIHGIEINQGECQKCLANLNQAAEQFGIQGVSWDVFSADTLTVDRFDGKMDYVVGNPPYVRVHNLQDYEAVKGFSFAKSGMTDLFLVFYEIGLRMLNRSGVLGYIAPSSIFNSLAGTAMRECLIGRRNIKAVVDLKHYQPFEATAYTAIMILTAQPQAETVYYEYDQQGRIPRAVSTLRQEDFCINGSFAFGVREDLNELKQIMSYSGKKACEVKNGFATLCDRFFIGDWDFTEYTIPVIKGSTGQWRKCLFPYDGKGKLLPFEALEAVPALRSHYEQNVDLLKKRSLGPSDPWYGFGRSQGISDVYKRKYAVNSLLRCPGDLKLSLCEPGTGVYSGLYILTEHSLDEIREILSADAFITYISMLGKYKSGGYYTYSSKDLQRYLNYKFAERGQDGDE